MVKRFKKKDGKQKVYEAYERLLGLWGVDITENDIDTTFGKTHIITSGNRENPPLLLFHGVGDNSAIMWIYNVQELVKHFYVIAVDTIGGPGKSEPNENYSKNFEQSLWIDDILNTLNIDKIDIAGVSNGAYIAQHYAITRLNRVNKFVCMAGSISTKNSPNPLFGLMKVVIPEALFPTEKNVAKLMKKLSGPNYDVFIKNEAIMHQWSCLLKYFNNMSMAYHKLKKFSVEEIATIREKSLFLVGDSDRLVFSPNTIKEFEDNKLNYKIIKNAGHGINHEQSELINNEIVNFILNDLEAANIVAE